MMASADAAVATGRLILIVLEVENLDASPRFYRDVLGVPLKPVSGCIHS
jgi:hypothetical protein